MKKRYLLFQKYAMMRKIQAGGDHTVKIEHLKYAICISECGSINKAAEKFFLSQPNLSNALKSLEAELGFEIFSRSNHGIRITPQGQKFLVYARKITENYDLICSIPSQTTHSHLSVAAGYHSVIEEAFAQFCSVYSDCDSIHFSLHNMSFSDILESVYQNKNDMGVILVSPERRETILDFLKNRNLAYETIADLKLYIQCRKNHPLLKEGDFSFKDLQNYPFIDYKTKTLSSNTFFQDNDIPAPVKTIFVDERDTRCRIIATTDAFSIGCGLHPRVQNYYDLVNVPLSRYRLHMLVIYSRSSGLTKEGKAFVHLLKKELDSVHCE